MSSAIFCRLIFHDFAVESIEKFLKLIAQHEYTTLSELTSRPPVSLNSELSDKNTEVEISFRLNSAPDGRKLDKSTKYYQICLAIAELTGQFEALRKEFYCYHGLPDHSTITMTILSKNIYPQFFKLQNVFSVDKFAFGSIVGRRNFNPTYMFDEPKNDNNEHGIFECYLDEQRDLQDIRSNMVILFEHDREFLTICFPDVLRNWIPKKDDDARSPNRVVDIRVAYAAVRRIIVAMSPDADDGFKVTFTFQLNFPPTIQIYEMSDFEVNEKTRTKFKPPHRFLTWNKGHDIQNSLSHGSCLVADCRMADARSLLDCLDRLRKFNHYAVEFRVLYRKNLRNIKNYKINCLMHPDDLPSDYAKLKEPKYFPLVYAIQALITRGGELYDYFFRPEYHNIFDFMDSVISHFDADLRANPGARIAKTVTTLENMLLKADKSNDIMEPLKFFLKLYGEPGQRILADITDDLTREGYMRVRKIIVTPTRKVYINPELIMGNRSLRREGAEKMLRIVFRDDNNHKVSSLPPPLIIKTVHDTLSNPMNVGLRDFSYLCSSNSQLRDHGCYFLAGLPQDVNAFRISCGKFETENISKMMSRLGQCFTQSRQLGIGIGRESYTETYDYTGGADSKGKPYIFSDGCGMISREFCRKIILDLKLGDCLPSCYQIRFRGYKGVVNMNSELDETRNWAKKHKKVPPFQIGVPLPWFSQSLMFRPSQRKFHAPREKKVEIVKISSPILVSLNKPLINILDQVSEMHGPISHERMCNRIFELMELHLESAISSLIVEPNAFLTLNEFPKYMLYDRLRDFNVTEEPFFRSMLRSSALAGLHRLVDKMQIRIPSSQGRMMFGVVDETGLLQYGQVFIQYTTNASLKYPSQHADKIVLSGPVMITKNPSVVAGDVRMFEAVDLPCLYDLVDVVVFPQSGPRPHPDQMAGSDLDGDEYSIFWDPHLFFDRNELAFDFTSTVKNDELNDEKPRTLTERMINFFVEYVSQDAIGTIANAHLANSDLYGINSQHCYNIALKHNQAVDFPKNGDIPEDLTKRWEGGLPPEKVERFPNFMCKGSQACYKSDRLLGNLHSRALEVREIIRVEEIASIDKQIKLDNSVLLPDDEYAVVAQTTYDEYCALITGICETYGILNEGQLFSGRFTALRRRINDKDDDNMSFFNTEHMIEEQVAEIYSKFRAKFFDDFGGIEHNTELEERRMNGIRETFRRVCTFPTEQMRKKASAYYRVAYTIGKYLSFGWLVADILSYNRQQYLLQPQNFKLSLCPLVDRLTNSINDICQSEPYEAEFEAYCNSLQQSYSSSQSISEFKVAKFCRSFIGLPKLLFVFRKWIELHGIDSNTRRFEKDRNCITPEIMDAIVVLFGLGELKKGLGGWLTACEFGDSVVNLEEQMGGLGKHFWSLIQFLKTRNFGFSKRISLEPVTKTCLESPQCLALYFAAEDTFYPIAVNRRFDCLPGNSDERKSVQKVTEGNTFVVEVPKNAKDYKILFENLATKCNCKYLVMRRKPDIMNAKSSRVTLKPVGSFMAVQKFRTLLEVAPCMTEPDLQRRSDMIAEEVYKRLEFYTENGRSIDDPFLP